MCDDLTGFIDILFLKQTYAYVWELLNEAGHIGWVYPGELGAKEKSYELTHCMTELHREYERERERERERKEKRFIILYK